MKTWAFEMRLVLRDGAAWLLLALFGFTLLYALRGGVELAERQRTSTESVLTKAREFDSQVRGALERQPIDPRQLARNPFAAVLPPAPLVLLAAGQSDLAPAYENVSLWRLETPSDARGEIENPSRLLTGRFDLAFVLVWLFPLFLLALIYDLVASDRESGVLRMVLARGAPPWRWILVRAAARATPVMALALGATVWSASYAGASAGVETSRIVYACGVVAAYGAFWVAVAVLVNALARSAAAAAAALGAAWVAVVLVVPTLLNLAVESLHPTPSRAQLVASARAASGDAERRGNEVLNSFYRDHPELAPPGMQVDFAQRILAVQDEVRESVDPVRRSFDDQLAKQQALVETWRFASPAIAAHEALTDVAGTGYWRHRVFREQLAAFKREVSDFYAPRIHKNAPLTRTDAASFPRFEFREEPAERWQARVGASLVGMLVVAALLALLAGRRLGARKLAA